MTPSRREAGHVDVVEEDVVIDDTELYELGQPAHDDDDDKDDHVLLPTSHTAGWPFLPRTLTCA